VMGVTRDDGKYKPAVIKAYDYGMLGTDRWDLVWKFGPSFIFYSEQYAVQLLVDKY
jgi:hypothetical protein